MIFRFIVLLLLLTMSVFLGACAKSPPSDNVASIEQQDVGLSTQFIENTVVVDEVEVVVVVQEGTAEFVSEEVQQDVVGSNSTVVEEQEVLGSVVENDIKPSAQKTTETTAAQKTTTAGNQPVTLLNNSPFASDDQFDVQENSSLELTELLDNDNDIDGDLVYISNFTQGDRGGLIENLGADVLRYTPSLGFQGTETFTYTIHDGNGLYASATVTMRVILIQETSALLVANPDQYTFLQDASRRLYVLNNDKLGDAGNISWVSSPRHGTLIVFGSASIRYTPDSGFFGKDSFTYTITDSAGNESTTTAYLNVAKIDPLGVSGSGQLPSAYPDQHSILQNASSRLYVLNNDQFGEAGYISWVSTPEHGTFIVFDKTSIRYIPAEDYYGTDSFTYEITDSTGGKSSATVFLNVAKVSPPDVVIVDPPVVEVTNKLPVAKSDQYTLQQDTSKRLYVLNNDQLGDAGDISWASTPGNGSVIVFDETSISYTPNVGYFGVDSFTYTLKDATGDKSYGTVTLDVTKVYAPIPVEEVINKLPVANSDQYTLQQDATQRLNVLENDELGDAAQISWVSTPRQGTLVVLDKTSISYTPPTGYIGSDKFTYMITDVTGERSYAEVLIDVTKIVSSVVENTNQLPVANPDQYTLLQDTSKRLYVLYNDQLGDAGNISWVSTPGNGSIIVFDKTSISYTPNAGYFGVDNFIYTITDATGDKSSASVSLGVSCSLSCERIFNVSWDLSSSLNVVQYKVYIGRESGKYTNVIAVGNTSQFEYIAKDLGDYYFAVSAVTNKSIESVLSKPVHVVF